MLKFDIPTTHDLEEIRKKISPCDFVIQEKLKIVVDGIVKNNYYGKTKFIHEFSYNEIDCFQKDIVKEIADVLHLYGYKCEIYKYPTSISLMVEW